MAKPKSLDDYSSPVTVWEHYGFDEQHINDCIELGEKRNSDFWQNSAEFLGDLENRPVDSITGKMVNWIDNIVEGLESAGKM